MKNFPALNVLTFDIEEWFHSFQEGLPSTWNKNEVRIHQNVDLILGLLDEFQVSASFFCVGWIAEQYPEVVRKIAKMGHEIGSHSHYHRLTHQLRYSEFEEDLKASIFSIEDVIGHKVKMYRAPGFSIRQANTWVFEILFKHGITIDSSLTAIRSETGGLKGFEMNTPCLIRKKGLLVKEFPLNYTKLATIGINYTGGGYFRLLPYSLTKRLLAKSSYNLVYFHPRDFDADQPVVNASWKRVLKNQIGLKHARKKFRRLLNDFTFVDLRTATHRINWDSVPSFTVNPYQ